MSVETYLSPFAMMQVDLVQPPLTPDRTKSEMYENEQNNSNKENKRFVPPNKLDLTETYHLRKKRKLL